MIGLEKLLDNSASARNFDKLASLVIDAGGTSVGLRFGFAPVSFTASADSSVATVSHGLGRAPAVVICTQVDVDINNTAAVRVGLTSDTTFQARMRTVDGSAISASSGFYWVVIG